MVLRIEIEGGATPILVYPKQEIIFGRRDPTSGGMPDVDLTPYAGYRMGVSRRHAAIRLQDKRLDVSDLGSSNGTFLNGTRLSAHRPYQLRDGDEIRLGQMVMRVFFQTNTGRK
jgi:pSer/pThr/pTyr-binding forkhead associated (FHA) protein